MSMGYIKDGEYVKAVPGGRKDGEPDMLSILSTFDVTGKQQVVKFPAGTFEPGTYITVMWANCLGTDAATENAQPVYNYTDVLGNSWIFGGWQYIRLAQNVYGPKVIKLTQAQCDTELNITWQVGGNSTDKGASAPRSTGTVLIRRIA